MQRIDNPPNDLFINGDPTTGTVGTRVMAEWLNSLQEEMCKIVEESGLTLDENDDTQVWTAIKQHFKNSSLLGRPKFTRVDTDKITIEPFVYHHHGTVEQLVHSDTQLTFQFANLAVSDWFYLYLDDSAIVTAGSNEISASELIASTTEPSWNAAKHGWYNGNDRCIFAVLTNSCSYIREFYTDGNMVSYGTEIAELENVCIGTTWTDAVLTLPKFSTRAIVLFSVANASDIIFVYWRTNGGAGSHQVTTDDAIAVRHFNTVTVITDSSQTIEVKYNTSDVAAGLFVFTQGWYFPIGM